MTWHKGNLIKNGEKKSPSDSCKKGFYISQLQKGHDKAMPPKRGMGKGAELIETTAKELLNGQIKRFCHLKREEQSNSTTEEAKANFHREPYMGMYRKQDQCGNGHRGREYDKF